MQWLDEQIGLAGLEQLLPNIALFSFIQIEFPGTSNSNFTGIREDADPQKAHQGLSHI